ncbi:MAG: hypothetical protein IK131_02410 [Paludibacteraceae bacterium]|nr:hypothetical protein [Paludibacteraceae bacterium]
MKKNFFKWAVYFTALATALTFASCGDDDEEEGGNGDNNSVVIEGFETFTAQSIDVKTGDVIMYSKIGNMQTNIFKEFKVVSATAGKVVLNFDGVEVTLSDADASYLSSGLEEWHKADAEANPAQVLMCLKSGTSTIIDGTKGGNEIVSASATPTYFKKK